MIRASPYLYSDFFAVNNATKMRTHLLLSTSGDDVGSRISRSRTNGARW